MSQNKQSIRKVIIITIVISFVVGGIAGGAIGVLYENFGSKFFSFEPEEELIQREIVRLEESSATIDVVEKVSPAVVSIVVSKDLSKYYSSTGPDIFPFDDIFDFDFPFKFEIPKSEDNGTNMQEVGWGSGFIVSADGLILTNKHVVSDEEAEYSVVTNEGKEYGAEVLARDPINDIAIIKIGAEGLPVVELGNSDNLKIGQTVIAIGNALGEYRNTVTRGVISGIGRTVVAGTSFGRSETLPDVIQTDAAINPGNSGGPLLNLDGQVVGINTAVSKSGQLIGFAIPINEAKSVIESVKKHGKIIRPFLGVRYIMLNKRIAKANNLSVDYGALILRGENREDLAIVPGSPADKAGLLENDIILELNGEKLTKKNSLGRVITKYQPGDEVELKVLSKGKEKTVKVVLEKREVE